MFVVNFYFCRLNNRLYDCISGDMNLVIYFYEMNWNYTDLQSILLCKENFACNRYERTKLSSLCKMNYVYWLYFKCYCIMYINSLGDLIIVYKYNIKGFA